MEEASLVGGESLNGESSSQKDNKRDLADLEAINKLNKIDLSNFKLETIYDIYDKIERDELKVEDLIFLDDEMNEVRVISIEKVPYSGRMYDVDVPNDIILVERNGLVVWSGNSNNGTASGGNLANESGKYGGAFRFDGINDYVEVSNDASIQLTSMTASVWIKPTTSQKDYATILDKSHTSPNGWSIEYDVSNPQVYFWINSNKATTTTELKDDKWHHLVATYDGSDMKIYVDGISEATTSYGGGITNVADPLFIGQWYDAGSFSRQFNGSIDDVQIWNRALSADEVYQLYATSFTRLNQDNWTLWVNQSLNATDGLVSGTYTYYANATDFYGNSNKTEIRTVTIDSTPPDINFTTDTPVNGTTTSDTTIKINVSIENAGKLNETIYNWNGTNFTVYDDSLVLFMNFNNVSDLGENDTHIFDLSNFGNNGTASGGFLANVSGKYGGAFRFDGVNDYVDVDQEIIPDGHSGGWTGCAWFKAPESNGRRFIFETSQTYEISLGIEDNDELKSFGDTTGTDVSCGSGNDVDDNVWHFGCGVFNPGDKKLRTYTDGIITCTSSASNSNITENTDGFHIGTYRDADGRFFNGLIDEVQIWKRALSADEIYQLYATSFTRLNQDNWTLWVNQSLNATDGLVDGSYTYYANTTDFYGNSNKTEIRTVTVDSGVPDIAYGVLTAADYSQLNQSYVYVNVTVTESNLENMSYTLYNESLNVTGLVGYWPFDRNVTVNDTAYVVDVSGEGNDGVSYNGVKWNGTGKLNAAMHFDGVDDYVSLSSTVIGGRKNATISAWVFARTGITDFDRIYDESSSTNADTFIALQIQNNHAKIFVRDDAGTANSAEGSTNIVDAWHHIVAVINDSGQVILYVDAVSEASATTSLGAITPNQATIGQTLSGASEPWKGSIDEVMIFNRSLSATEISELYNRSVVNHTTYATETLSINWTGLADNDYHYYADILDKVGNYNFTSIRSITLDSTNPDINFTVPTPLNASTQSNTDIFVNYSVGETTGYSFIDFDNSNVLWMRMDNVNSDGNPYNNGSAGGNGSLIGSVINSSSGKFGDGAFFDGKDDYMTIDSVSSFSFAETGTVSAWFKFDDTTCSSSPVIISAHASNYESAKWMLKLVGSGCKIEAKNSLSGGVGDDYGGNGWHHVVAIYNDTNKAVDVYADGLSIGQQSGGEAYDLDATFYSIGQEWDAGPTPSNFWNGSIDEVLIFNRSLSADEVTALYNATRTYRNFTSSSEGSHTFTAYVVDGAANRNSTNERTVTIDSTPPDINFTVDTPINDTTTSDTTIKINVSIENVGKLNETIYNWNGTNFTVYNDSLVLFMNFNNVSDLGENDTLVMDLSNSQNNGTGSGGNLANVSGKYGGAFSFDGDDDYVSIDGLITTLASDINGTISFWAKIDEDDGNENVVFGVGRTDASQTELFISIDMRTGGDQVYALLKIDGTTQWLFRTPEDSLDAHVGNWLYITVVQNGTEPNIYFNGVSQTMTKSTTTDTTKWFKAILTDATNDATTLRLGHLPRFSSYFNGSIDDVQIWNRALSADEVYQLYATSFTRLNQDNWTLWVNQSLNATDGLIADTYTYFAAATDFYNNENMTEIRTAHVIGKPSGNKFALSNNTNNNIFSIDDVGNMYLVGTVSQSQSTLSVTSNSFIVQNSTGSAVCYVNNTGSLLLRGIVNQSSDLGGLTSGNLEFRNSTDNLVAFFDNKGNLQLQGRYIENFDLP